MSLYFFYYFAVIPANVRYDEKITERSKLLYGEITCLSNKEGYCFATNKYFSKLYNCSERTIQNSITELRKRGYIKVVVQNCYQRKIFIIPNFGNDRNFELGYEKNFIGGYENNFTHNNINNNKLDSLFNYIIKKEKKIPKKFEGYEEEILEVLDKFELIYPKEIVELMEKEIRDKIKTVSYAVALAVKENVGHLLFKINRDKLFSLYDECKIREHEYKNTNNKIISFSNYFYKSLKGQLLKDKSSSFFA